MKILDLLFGDSALRRLFNALFGNTSGPDASEPTTPEATDTVAVYRPGEGKHFHAEVGGLGGGPYKSYVAEVTQTGTDDPVATVIYNDLNGTPVWSRVAMSLYKATLAGAFPVDRTLVGINGVFSAGAVPLYQGPLSSLASVQGWAHAEPLGGNNEIAVQISDPTNDEEQEWSELANPAPRTILFEIRVYPEPPE